MSPVEKSVKNQLVRHDDLTMDGACSLLREGDITGCQPLPRGSNCVYLLSLRQDGIAARAIYKPRRGEAPLWDFPEGTLYQREYAAYLVSQALKWSLVPPTVIRDGPYGVGMLQWFVDTRQTIGYPPLIENHIPEFKRIAAFDWLVNNADRKGGHCLEGLDGRLWLIDHGLTFNMVPKLRTVIWDFSGQPVPEELSADLESLRQQLNGYNSLTRALSELLSFEEIQALKERLTGILESPIYPYSFGSHRRTPWPPY
jgi:hypothetical protein